MMETLNVVNPHFPNFTPNWVYLIGCIQVYPIKYTQSLVNPIIAINRAVTHFFSNLNIAKKPDYNIISEPIFHTFTTLINAEKTY